MTQQEMNIQYDSLIGNINRMCVTDNLSEMIDMYEYAQKRLDKIYQYNKNRLLDKENKEWANSSFAFFNIMLGRLIDERKRNCLNVKIVL